MDTDYHAIIFVLIIIFLRYYLDVTKESSKGLGTIAKFVFITAYIFAITGNLSIFELKMIIIFVTIFGKFDKEDLVTNIANISNTKDSIMTKITTMGPYILIYSFFIVIVMSINFNQNCK